MVETAATAPRDDARPIAEPAMTDDKMSAAEYRAALSALGLTQNRGADLVGVDQRTSRRWANAERDVAPPAARFLRYLIHVGADPERVIAILDGRGSPAVGLGGMQEPDAS